MIDKELDDLFLEYEAKSEAFTGTVPFDGYLELLGKTIFGARASHGN